jgi:hypothetical protein
MYDPAIATKDLLVAANVGAFNVNTGWCICIGVLPDVPDTVILCNQAGGLPPYPHLLVNEPRVQVMVRGKRSGYTDASAKIRAVMDALLGLSSQSLGGDTYQSCTMLGDISFLGQDDNTRPLFVANFQYIVLPVAGAGHRVPIT